MKLPSIPYLFDAFMNVIRRFPLVMAAATIGVLATMILIENEHSDSSDQYVKIILTCSLGLASLLCSALVVEKWKLKIPISLVPHMVAVGLLLLYYFTMEWSNDFDNIITPVRFGGLVLAAHLGVAFVPYLDASPVEDFWEYNKRLFGNFMVGAFYSLVIFTGLSIAILAVNELFSLSIDENIYGHLFVLIAGIFNTAFFLANFPSNFDFESEAAENEDPAPTPTPYTSSFKNLTKFILIPIIAIYFLILYAFSAKILVQWELPEGWVGKLVLGFSVAGIFTYLLNYLLVKYDDSLAVKGFRRWFFYILLPMVLLLFVAIGRRINDYGFTEARYVVVVSGIWLMLMSVYFIFSKRDNIKFIPISLALISIVTVLGPLSAFKVSERNQIKRLTTTLEKNNMLKDGIAVPLTDSLSKEDSDKISGAIQYLGENGHFGKVATMFGLPAGTNNPSWGQRDSLLNFLRVQTLTWASGICYLNFIQKQDAGLDIRGYDQLYNGYLSGDQSKIAETFELAVGNKALIFFEKGEIKDSFDLRPFIAKLKASDSCQQDHNSIENDSLANEIISTANYNLKLMSEMVQLKKLETEWEIESWSGRLLLSKRQ